MNPKYTLDTDYFNHLVEDLCFHVCEYGISKSDPNDPKAFLINTHDGWKKAQSLVIENLKLVLELESCLDNDKNDLKKTTYESNKKKVNRQKLILRSVIDSIIWHLFRFQHHVLRRYFQALDIDNLSIKTIEDHYDDIQSINTQKNQIAVLTDISNFFQVGDIIRAEFDENHLKLEIIEVKKGRKNHEIIDKVFDLKESGINLEDHEPKELDLSETDYKHARRVHKQIRKFELIDETLKHDEGTDIFTGEKLFLSKKHYPIDTYEDHLFEIVNEIKKKTWAIRVIENCLYIGLYRDQMKGKVGLFTFSQWIKNFDHKGPVILYDSTLSMPLSRPILSAILPTKLKYKVLAQEWTLLFSINVREWISMIKEIYDINIYLSSKKEARRQNNPQLYKYDDRLIVIEREKHKEMLGWGFFSKIFFDFYSPIDSGKVLIESVLP